MNDRPLGETRQGSSEAALRMTAISKRFPGVQALHRAELVVSPGEVHGLVGENGAGKSTIIKVLAGVYRCDEGVVEIGGAVVDPITPQAVRDMGVRFIHQELNLVPHFTVAESVFMGQEKSSPFGIRKRAMRAAAEAFLHNALSADIDGNALIRDLSVADRKLVQIARALVDGQARLVVFDEPTAVLPAADVETVFESIRLLKERGIAMVYVSHYLAEITEICDRVTVFRNGKSVGVVDNAAEAGVGEIIKLMVGREIGDLYPEKNNVPAGPVLRIEGLSDVRHFRNVSFEVRAGETVGLAGLVGSGREELVDAIYGMRRVRSGSVELNSAQLQLGDAANAVANGLVLVPRDRRNHGLVLGFSVGDNINLASLDEVAVRGWLKPAAATARANAMIERIDVRPPDPNRIARFLSGGNQQKVVLARWLATKSIVFLMDEPTVGVDVGAKAEIYRLIAELASAGAGVLVASHDLGELMGLCDRVLVMVRGEIVANEKVEDLTLDGLLALTTASQSDTTGRAS